MAIITTATVSGGDHVQWSRPGGTAINAIPIGQLNFRGGATIPLKITTNDSLWTLSCTLPRNFVWIPTKCTVQAFSAQEGDLDGWEDGILGRTNDGVDDIDIFNMYNMTSYYHSTGFDSYFWEADTGADAKTTSFDVAQQSQFPSSAINCDTAPGAITLNWFSNSSSEIDITTILFRVSALQYTIEQFREWPLHTANQVLRPI